MITIIIHAQVKLSANDPGNPVTVFNNTVSLNQQAMDCEGEIKHSCMYLAFQAHQARSKDLIK